MRSIVSCLLLPLFSAVVLASSRQALSSTSRPIECINSSCGSCGICGPNNVCIQTSNPIKPCQKCQKVGDVFELVDNPGGTCGECGHCSNGVCLRGSGRPDGDSELCQFCYCNEEVGYCNLIINNGIPCRTKMKGDTQVCKKCSSRGRCSGRYVPC